MVEELVTSGQTFTVASGVTSSVLVQSAGSEVVAAGGTDSASIVSGAQIVSGAAAVTLSTTVVAGGVQSVLAGGTAVSATLKGGSQFVSGGGTATATTIESGGSANLYSGAVANSTLLLNGGTMFVVSGSATHTDIRSGGSQVTGGVAISTLVEAGGSDVIQFGIDSATTVASGGQQIVQFGSGIVSATILSGGEQIISQGGAASDTRVQSGAAEQIAYGGTAFGTLLAGGAAIVSASGATSNTTVQAGGIELVLSGGSAYGTTVDSGGALIVLPGGHATGGTVAPGGSSGTASVVLQAATSASAWATSANGVQVGSGAVLTVLSGGEVVAASLGTNSSETVAAGGRDIGTTLSGFAQLDIAGSGSGETLGSGAFMTVSSGASITGVTVAEEGNLTVYGSATATTLSGGDLDVGAGAVVSGIGGAGQLTIGGLAYNISANLGGRVGVRAGGSAFNVSMGFLGSVEVDSGGTASNVTLGGNLDDVQVYEGGTLDGTLNLAQGALVNLTFYGSAMPTAVISNFAGADAIDLGDIAYDPAGSATYAGGTLDVHEGGQTYALNIAASPQYASGRFVLNDDGDSGTTLLFVGPSSHIVSSGQTGGPFAVGGGDFIVVSVGGTNVSATLHGAAPFITYQSDPTDGGTLFVNSNSVALAVEENSGTDSGTAIGLGGNVLNLGKVVGDTVASGGLLFSFLGTTSGVVVGSGGIELMEAFTSGTYTSGTVVNGGLQGLAGSAVSYDTVVNSGGEQVVGGQVSLFGSTSPLSGGIASATIVTNGGKQFVNASAVAQGTQIGAGGQMLVNSGGSAYAPTIAGGGSLLLGSGAVVGSGITFTGAGADLKIAGTSMPTTTLFGVGPNDTIDLTDIAPGANPTATLDSATGILTIDAGGGSLYTLHLSGAAQAPAFVAMGDGGSGTLVEIPCYAAGTRIAAASGEVAVEALAVGQMVRTHGGRLAPVRWVGRRLVDCRRHPNPPAVLPIRIRAGAFAPGQPKRDLLLSPDHAVFAGGVLIPVRHLVNGTTVAQMRVARIEYVHVELDRHDILLAEGLPAESYLDTGNRTAFAGGGAALQLYPDFTRKVWDAEGCADLVVAGPKLAAVRRTLLARAAGGRVPLSRGRSSR